MMNDQGMRTFSEFWPHYVRQHSKPGTRLFHAIGSTLAVIIIMVALATDLWWMLLAPVIGYGFAWTSHLFIEGNRPATFGHPIWSLAADYRMLFLMIAGRMDQEVSRCVPPAEADANGVASRV